jgi:hypothetical protein
LGLGLGKTVTLAKARVQHLFALPSAWLSGDFSCNLLYAPSNK